MVTPSCFGAEVLLQNIRMLAGIPAGTRSAMLINQIGLPAEPRHIFRVVPAGFGNVIPRPAEHRHRIRIIQKSRVRAISVDVCGDIQHHGNGSQCPKDSRWSARIADVDIGFILYGNFYIVLEDLRSTHQHGAQHTICAIQCLGTIKRENNLSRGTCPPPRCG